MDSSYLFYVFAGRIPLIILLIAGIVFAVTRWNRHPKVSFLTILALLFNLLESTLFTFMINLMATVLPTGSLALGEAAYTVLYILDDMAYAAVLILLVVAAFSQRAGNAPNPVVSA